MSSIFQGLVQSSTGLVNFSVGTGAIPIIAAEMRGLRINAVADAEGAFPVYASVGQASASVGSGGLSFDAYGRLRITTTVPSTIVQLPGGIIADETGSLVVFGPAEILYQGVALTYIGYVSALSQTPVPLFYWKGQNTLAATTGTDPTFTRATAATFEDFEGLIKTVESSEPRFQGARRVENIVPLSEDLTNAAWGQVNCTVAAGQTDPDGGSTAFRLTATGSFGRVTYPNITTVGQTALASWWIKRVTGTGTVEVCRGSGLYREAVTITSEWKRVAPSPLAVSLTGSAGIFLVTSGDAVDIWHPQMEYITGQTNQNPSEYVSTGVATGPELVTNGDFATDVSNWTPYNSAASATWDNGSMLVTTTQDAWLYQAVSVEIGKTYKVEVTGNAPDYGSGGPRLELYIGADDGPNYQYGILRLYTATQTVSTTFTATGTTIWVKPRVTTAGTVRYDNISFKAVDHGANVDGVEYFNTLNANTVTANVVTEAVGSPLTRANTQFGDLHGVAGDYFSTPNVVTTWGELDIRARAQIDSFPNGYAFLADKNSVFYLAVTVSQQLILKYYTAIGTLTATVAIPNFTFGVRSWYRATLDTSTGVINLYVADGNLESPTSSDWVNINTTNQTVSPLNVNNSPFVVGAFGLALASYYMDGDIYRSQVFNEIDGTTPVVDFDFGDYVSGSTWNGIPYGPEQITNGDFSSATGWTLNGNSTIAGGVASNLGAGDYIAQGFSTTPNQSYVIFFDALAGSNSGNSLLRIGTSANSNSILNTSLGGLGSIPSRLTTTFTATGTTTWITFYQANFTSSYSNVSVKENQVFTLEGNASIFQPPVDESGPFGYLAEKASTNLALQSEDFTTSWGPQGVTVAVNAAVAPDGTTTMDRLAVTTVTNYHNLYQVTSTTANTNYTASVYMKNDGAGFGGVVFHGGNVDFIAVMVNLSTGLVTDTLVGATSGTLVASGCDDVGNGVYRVWVSGSVVNSSSYIMPFVSDAAVFSSNTGGRPTYTGVLGEDILVWGAQLEQNATYPTSYIPTTTTAVTRNADVLIAGDMVTDAAGSAYTEASSIWGDAGASYHYLLARDGNGRILDIYSGTSSFIRAYAGTGFAFSPTGTSYQNRPAPMASTWGDNLTVYKDGVGGTAIAYNGTMGSGNLGIGNVNGSSGQWNGTVREVKIFDSELTAEEVGDL